MSGESDKNISQETATPMNCPEVVKGCKKTFKLSSNLMKHMKKKHQNNEEEKGDSELDKSVEIMIQAVEEEEAREFGECADEAEERLGIKLVNNLSKKDNEKVTEDKEIEKEENVKVVNIVNEVPMCQGPANFYVSNPEHPLTQSQRIKIPVDIENMQEILEDDNGQNTASELEHAENVNMARKKFDQMYNCFISQISEGEIEISEQRTSCGNCSKTFNTEEEGHKHMDTVHSCQNCKIKNMIIEKDEITIKKILLKVKILTRDKRTLNIQIKALITELAKSNKLLVKYKKEADTLKAEKETILEEKKIYQSDAEKKKDDKKKTEETNSEKDKSKEDNLTNQSIQDPNKIGKCRICGFKSNFEGLKAHRAAEHHESLKYKCSRCEKIFAFKKVLRVHQHMHDKSIFVCSICKLILPNKEAFQNHKQKKCKTRRAAPTQTNVQPGGEGVGGISPTQNPENELPCQMCSYKTNNQTKIIEHIKKEHDPKPRYQCDSCGKRFNKTEELVKHILNEHTNVGKNTGEAQTTPLLYQARQQDQSETTAKKLPCQMCDYKANNQSNLIDHIKKEHDPKPKYQCDLCGTRVNQTEELVDHLIKEHTKVGKRGDEVKQTGITKPAQRNQELWNCYFCGLKDLNKVQRDDHICYKHPFKTTLQQKKQIQRKSIECMWGQWCTWFIEGKCWYKHDPNSLTWTEEGRSAQRVQESTNGHNQNKGDEHFQGGRRNNLKWCAYQDKCDRKEWCNFRHFEDITGENEEEVFLVEMVKTKAQELNVNPWRDF